MELERKKDTSIVYWLMDTFSDVSSITILDEYSNRELEVPSLALQTGLITDEEFQLGDRTQKLIRLWHIDIYAKSTEQRNEIAYRLLRELDDGIPVYDYDEGFPPDIDPSRIGTISVFSKEYTPIAVVPELLDKMYWRGSVTIFTEYSEV